MDIRWVDECLESKTLLAANRIISPTKSTKRAANTERSAPQQTEAKNDLLELESNDILISELVNRMNYHKLKKDKFKVLAYRKAIQSITESNQIIKSGKQALKFPHIGKSIAGKVQFI